MTGQTPQAAREFLLELRSLDAEAQQFDDSLFAKEAKPCLADKVLDKLHDYVSTPQFLGKLETAVSAAVTEPAAQLPLSAQLSQNQDDFVLIDKTDAIEALAYYIAGCVATAPEAQSLSPAELQRIVNTAFKGLKKNKFQLLLHHGRRAYRCAAVGYSVFQLYENPWLMRAIATAVWAFVRFSIGLPVVLPFPRLGIM